MSEKVVAGPMQRPGTWDAVSATYAEDVGQWRAHADEALKLSPVVAGQRVLDLACGPGTLAFLAAAQGAKVDAVDFSPGMIGALEERASREGALGITARVMDAQALDFADATFDAVYCLFAFFFLPDRARAFAEVSRVLKPSGRFLMATWGPIERRPVMQLGFEAVAEALPDLPRPAKGDLQQPDECVREMLAAGFRDVQAHVCVSSARFESAEHYLDLMIRSGAPFALMKQKLGDEAWGAARGRMLESVRKRFPGPSVDLTAEAILTLGAR
jgi:SAM-dependent methyltransferase